MSILNQVTNDVPQQPVTEDPQTWSGLGALTNQPNNVQPVPQNNVAQPDIFSNNLGPGIPPEAQQHIDRLHQQLLAHNNNVDETGYHQPTPFSNFLHTLGDVAHFIPGLNMLTDPMMRATANKNISDNRMDWATYEKKNKEYLDAKARADVALKKGEQPNVVPEKPKKPLTMEEYLSKSDLLNYVKTNVPGASHAMANENINKAIMDNQPHVAYRMALNAGYNPQQAHQMITQGISNKTLATMSDKMPELIANNDGKGINALLAKNIKNLNDEDIGKVSLLYKQTADTVKNSNKALADKMLATSRMLHVMAMNARTKQLGLNTDKTNATRLQIAQINKEGRIQAAATRNKSVKQPLTPEDIIAQNATTLLGVKSNIPTVMRVLKLPGGIAALRKAQMMPIKLDKPPEGVEMSPTGYYIKGPNGSVEPANRYLLDAIDKKMDQEEGPQQPEQQSLPEQTTSLPNEGWNGSGEEIVTPEEIKNNPKMVSIDVPAQNVIRAAANSDWGSNSIPILQQAARDGLKFVHWGTGMYVQVEGHLIPIRAFIKMAEEHQGSK